jgi:hypothetical protein
MRCGGLSMSERSNPEPIGETLDKLHDLMVSIGKPGVAVYIDIYPVDPQSPEEYAYDYWETNLDGKSVTEDFRNGRE